MATKKKTTETEVTPMTESEAKESELMEALEAMKKEKEALMEQVEALKKNTQKVQMQKPKKKDEYDADYWNEKVEYEAFYDGDKYSDDISVMVNGKRFLIQRGKKVMIPRYVLHVLENQAKQRKASAEYNRSLQEEFQRETKRYIGE